MAPPAGGATVASAAASDPDPAAVLLAVHAAVRPLDAGPEADASLRRLQLSADPERPGRFRLQLRGSGPGAVNLEWPLESVSYTIRSPHQHELRPPPGGPGTLSLDFLDPLEAQQWAALVRGATMEGQNAAGSPLPAPGPASLSSLPGPPRPHMDAPRSPEDLVEKEELAGRLACAIAGGDRQAATKAAAILARHHVPLSVWLQEVTCPAGPIRLQVSVEDAASSAHVVLRVHPHRTIAALQEQVFSELGFPPAVQRWVIGRHLCVPERSLASYGVWQDGDPAFLYLLSAPHEAPGPSAPRSQKTGRELGRWFPQLLRLPRALPPTSSSLPSPLQPSWSCPSCTFINAQSRPGCEMCGTQRPFTGTTPPAQPPASSPPKVARRGEPPLEP